MGGPDAEETRNDVQFMPLEKGTRRRSMFLPTKPSMAGRSVREASSMMSTLSTDELATPCR